MSIFTNNFFFIQDPNQKEDDLSAVHVKQGFINNHSSALDEFGSNLTKMANFNNAAVWKSFQDILVKKEELNTFAVRTSFKILLVYCTVTLVGHSRF